MAQALNNIPLDNPPDLPSLVDCIFRQISSQPARYSVRILLSNLAATGYYFKHVWPGGKNKNSVYNKEANVNYTPLDESPEVILHDGTKVVFPIELDKSVSSRESSGPPDYDSDGNKIREDNWDYEQVNPNKPWLGRDPD